ncbi:Vinylacetyl-CoA Delta-isomerase [Desulfatibacillum aliphaticivorans]|uniref:Vinylacetyl-CoA Delta-isomerase n=1 Tax=Desulfatibacillum aliphaticivorans TaxID=218208 RepID=B8FFG9_DESAL|nr:4-hydroxyphenylacetate 3-hydroxylase N-terminal domain-containing protein [Desulfatibacillum aliphaticivorans]ACL04229.1 Vinylacetyl-CoA Delta-isomerase [Desulfatibacillum aliphaticivorans]
MAIITGEQFRESLKEVSPEIYIRGERVEDVASHPLLKQTVHHLAAGCDLLFDPELKDRLVVRSPISGEDIPRLGMHIQQEKEDLFIKAELTREISSRRICSACGSNMLSVTWAMIHDVDAAHGTDYLSRYRDFIIRIHKTGLPFAWCMMDPKGDRSLPPSRQPEPTDLRIVERKPGGVVVNGVKLHTTMGPCTRFVVAVPCRALGKKDKDFAVSFALPIETKGIKMIARPSPGPSRETSMESPLSSRFMGVEAMTIFDNVFVPEENLFMCGEWEQAGNLSMYFASLHRQSKCACSAGHCDMFAGAAALAADVNGVSGRASHIQEKITSMIMDGEAGYGCALGAAVNARRHPSGVWMPDPLIANSGLGAIRSKVGRHMEHLHDIAGGLIATMPTEADWNNPELRKYMDKALRGNPKYTTEERLRAMHLIQDLAASRAAGTIMAFTINAAGSPATNQVVVRRAYDLDKQIRYAKELASIKT